METMDTLREPLTIETAQNLVKQLTYTKSAKNNSLPILENVFFNNGSIIATDLANTTIVNTEIKETFLVDRKMLLDMIKKVNKKSQVYFILGNGMINVGVDGAHSFSLATLDHTEFPRTYEGYNWEDVGALSKSDIESINKAAKFTSKDELKLKLNGVHLKDSIAATCAHRLAWVKIQGTLQIDKGCIISKQAVGIISKWPAADVSMSGVNMKLVNGDHTLITRLIDEEFPNYESVIPTYHNVSAVFSKDELLGKVELATITANERNFPVTFKFNNSHEAELSSGNDEVGSYNGTINTQVAFLNTDKEFKIGFNGKLLVSIIKECGGDWVEFRMTECNRAVTIHSSSTMQFLIMPVNIS